MKSLAILGASGHGKVVADAAVLAGWHSVMFFDDAWPRVRECGPWSVVGSIGSFVREPGSASAACVAIGDNAIRLRIHRRLIAQRITVESIVHPGAIVSPYSNIDRGSLISAGAVVGPFSRLGEACIVNTRASVDHDCEIGDGVHISPGAHIGGGVRIRDSAWVGIGATVKHDVAIGSAAIIGAGAVVVNDVEDSCTVVGIPAKTVTELQEC